MSLFSEQEWEAEGEGLPYVLRKKEFEAQREHHRLQHKLVKLQAQVEARNQQVRAHPHCHW